MPKFTWIDEEIVLDFEVPKLLKNTIEEIEQADIMQDKAEYNILSDTIDVLSKNFCSAKILTQKQWDTICQKYPMVL